MNARAANVFMQESQRAKVTEHKTSLFLTGFVLAMTNDYAGGANTSGGLQGGGHTDALGHTERIAKVRESDNSMDTRPDDLMDAADHIERSFGFRMRRPEGRIRRPDGFMDAVDHTERSSGVRMRRPEGRIRRPKVRIRRSDDLVDALRHGGKVFKSRIRESDDVVNVPDHIRKRSEVRVCQSDVPNHADISGFDADSMTGSGQPENSKLREILEHPEKYSEDLLQEGFVEVNRESGTTRFLPGGSTGRKVWDLRRLVVLNKHLSYVIGKKAQSNPADNEHTYIQAVEDYLSICEEYILCSPDEATAVERLQELVAIKLCHVAALENNSCAESAASQIWAKYLHMAPRELIVEHFRKKMCPAASNSIVRDEADLNDVSDHADISGFDADSMTGSGQPENSNLEDLLRG
eukprot:Blabericola_migrator_1__9377@NODE_505_length_7965_cov_11_786781_g387_i0_p1_GENE_NODE_505_length_7965_cov_11_786781_g387_i0NODE_505_length_7965_cov_11_786781_g387_i0_p1_ORF_typecomplete_len408_score53_61BrnA_antitoxin/PF14384_6/0_18_NODE_505_length_7965_cov_11_786781_g387_i066727895